MMLPLVDIPDIVQHYGDCSKDYGSRISPACLMQRLRGLISVLGTRFSEHVKGNTSF